jgi:hypothetical protein
LATLSRNIVLDHRYATCNGHVNGRINNHGGTL